MLKLLDRLFNAQTIIATADSLIIDGEAFTFNTESFAINLYRPPNDETKLFGWNTRLRCWVPCRGDILNVQQDQLSSPAFRAKIEKSPLVQHSGYFVSHWMYAPKGPS